MALVMPMRQLPRTRVGAAQVIRLAWMPAGRRASISARKAVKAAAEISGWLVSSPRTRIRLAAGSLRACR
jgi:hypothetical protein